MGKTYDQLREMREKLARLCRGRSRAQRSRRIASSSDPFTSHDGPVLSAVGVPTARRGYLGGAGRAPSIFAASGADARLLRLARPYRPRVDFQDGRDPLRLLRVQFRPPSQHLHDRREPGQLACRLMERDRRAAGECSSGTPPPRTPSEAAAPARAPRAAPPPRAASTGARPRGGYRVPVRERMRSTSAWRYGVPSVRKMSWNQTGGSVGYAFSHESQG